MRIFPLSVLSLVAIGLQAQSSPGGKINSKAVSNRAVVTEKKSSGNLKPAEPGESSGSAETVARPVRAVQAPRIDGYDDDEVWKSAVLIDAFRQYEPTENGEPTFRTEAKIAYDAHNLYALVRSYDPRPDSIMAVLERRDKSGLSDNILLVVDSYHDKRTAYIFRLNAAGSMADGYLFDDGYSEDWGWNAVWEGAARVDSLGWIAEYRIPLSQLRYVPGDENTFGIAILRTVARTGEATSYPRLRKSLQGIINQFASTPGFANLSAPRRVELMPYTMTSYGARPTASGSFRNAAQVQAGLDAKIGLTSNITLDAAVNPDFGQVEADPAVLNLSAFEQFYSERRPLFLEGSGIFRYDLDCNDGSCTGLFYSRRIGRSPQLRDTFGDAASPIQSRIMGAAKVTGRLGNGLSIGVLNAMTGREIGALNRTIEPQTNYSVIRLQQDMAKGNSGIGFMLTNTARNNDEWTDSYLRSNAITGGLDARHQFAGNRWQVSGKLAGSRVSGSANAIALTQKSNVHLFQRPDARYLDFDSTRTSLSGWMAEASLDKRAGGIVRLSTNLAYVSPDFEINDIGFRTRADEIQSALWLALVPVKPFGAFRQGQLNFNAWSSSNTGGMITSTGANVNANGQFRNFWSSSAGISVNNVGNVFNDRGARGGPAFFEPALMQVWFNTRANDRWKVSPVVGFNGYRQFDGLSSSWGTKAGVALRLGAQLSGSLTAQFSRNIDDQQWNGNYTSGGVTSYTFARLYQSTSSVTARINYTVTPTISIQSYFEPFISTGYFTDWRALADAKSADRSSRFRPFTSQGAPEGFRFGQFRTNNVVRWEYRPGSTLFFVWTQARDAADSPDDYSVTRGYRTVFGRRPENIFLIKASYWLGR